MKKWFFRGPFIWFAYGISVKNVYGLENVPKKNGFIVAANHSSYMDIWSLSSTFLRKLKINIRFLAKKELYDMWLLRWFLSSYAPIPFDRKLQKKIGLKEALNTLKKGDVVGLYPEGTRSLTGKIQKGKTGVARLALCAKVPVVPVGIKGAFEVMPKGTYIPRFKKNIIITIGKPMYFNKYYNKPITKKLLRKITDTIMREIAKLSGQRKTK
ncbi:1-acyl-sn-glycerol-3-phosphate acyltransferase [Candidatus Woesearchaeota archaeon]|nr:1-acyl-sn-glycerol-3-phosphate acyltransferase [Candidatus Woesearchaeota archaeon]|tara:strand:+ start:1777 stop:2412 length:636 start_codon:yes stop_codon:yes gene_type:complete